VLACAVDCTFDTAQCTGTPACTDDSYEENDDQAGAAALALGTHELFLCSAEGGEQDWFAIALLAGQAIVVTADFVNADLDIDMGLFDAAGVMLEYSAGSSDQEQLEYAAAADETVFLGLEGYLPGQAPYTLTIATVDCVDDDGCGDGEVCADHVCIVPGCLADGDCPLGQVCVDFGCVATNCAADADCAEYGMVCDLTAGWCVECNTVADCADETAFTCDGNRCVLQCVEDAYEPNDTRETAAAFPALAATDLTLCGERENDWYEVEVQPGWRYQISVLFTHADGDIDIYLLDAAGTTVASGVSSDDDELIDYYTDEDEAGTYTLRVYLYSSGIYTQTYDLSITTIEVECHTDADCALGQVCDADVCLDTTCLTDVDCETWDLLCDETAGYCVECVADGDCGANQACVANVCEFSCADDAYEENDTKETAAALTAGTHDLAMCDPDGNEEDWFAIDVAAGVVLGVQATFTHAQGDLDIALFPADSTTAIDTSSGVGNSEVVTRPAGDAATVYLRVLRIGSGASAYQLSVAMDPACVADSECGEGNICQGFACTPGCRTDAGCADGFICEALTCVAGCRTTFDCPDEEVCNAAHECVVPGCLEDAECQLGDVCEDYECLTTTCTADAECDDYGFVCDEAESWCVECTADGECGANEACIGSRCVFQCADDDYEPNDTKDAAALIEAGTYPDLAICEAPNATEEDWYAVALLAGDTLVVRTRFTHATADLELKLFRLDSTTALDTSFSSTDQEEVVYTAESDMTVYIQVYSAGTGRGAPYEMSVILADCEAASDCLLGEACVDYACQFALCATDADCAAYDMVCDEPAEWCVECAGDEDCPAGFACLANLCELSCVEDAYEPNSTQADAALVTLDLAETDLSLCGENDADWFTFELAPLTSYQIVVSFVDDDGDVDIYLSRRNEDGTLTQVRSSAGSSDTETIDYVTDAAGGTFYLRVYLYGWGVVEQSYDLSITTIGAIECNVTADCDALQICQANVCVDVECVTAADCDANEGCLGNVCVPIGAGDTCGTAFEAEPGTYEDVDIAAFQSDLSFATSSCTGYGTAGRDAVYMITIPAGQTLTANLTATFDAALYVIDDCSVIPLPVEACLVGADDVLSNETETVTYTAGAAAAETVYVVVDYFLSGGPASGTFDLTLALQ